MAILIAFATNTAEAEKPSVLTSENRATLLSTSVCVPDSAFV